MTDVIYYLSGAMRGFAFCNYPLFESITKRLRSSGYKILSPHEVNTQGTPRDVCMTRDVLALLECAGVICIEGWERSPGACVEVAMAWAAGLAVYQLSWTTAGDPVLDILETRSVTIPREYQYQLQIPLVGLCGFAQAGKDTVANRLVTPHEWERVAFADTLRDMLYALDPIIDVDEVYGEIDVMRAQQYVDEVGWDKAKTSVPEVRDLLQRLGTEAGRNILGNDTWVRLAEEHIEAAVPLPVVVSDCRFPNELQMVRRRGGVLVWIDRPGTEAVNAHASEHSVSKDDCDLVITNDGSLEALYREIDLLATTFKWDPLAFVKDAA